MFSNKYIFIYSAVMVFIVALVLSLVATFLQPKQQENIDNEKKKNILASVQITAQTKEVSKLFEKYVKREIVVDETGAIVSIFENNNFTQGNLRAFDINLREQLKNIATSGKALLPLFEIEYNNSIFKVIPLYGKGLWGPIWGTIALKSDLRTVAGVTFSHKAETPGLGAEIITEAFTSQFINKQIFNENDEFVSVRIVKGGVSNQQKIPEIHGVDGISGGTITCDGTSEMIYSNLKNYLPYFEKIIKDESK